MSTYSRNACLAWLASAGLSPSETEALLRENADPVSLYRDWAGGKRPGAARGISVRIQEALTHNSAARWMDAWENVILKCGIQAVTFQDADYPDRLRPLGDAPAVLFYQGNLSAVSDGPTVSVVGSRSASSRGLEATRKIAKRLSQAGIRIVSGLAYGIDAAAHQGCLKGGSPTVAVLGCGLDQDYPAENAGLKREILAQGGAVISEYAPGEKPLGWHFPYRNRIISGLGDCVILMEARIRSGSMTTVQHALDQGKDVFVYPGDPESIKCEGNRQLLREGAIYFTTAEDLMEDMRWLDKKNVVGQNSVDTGETVEASMTPDEKRVWNALEGEDRGFDELCGMTGFPAAQLNVTLSMLQIRNLVRALPGKRYQRNQPE